MGNGLWLHMFFNNFRHEVDANLLRFIPHPFASVFQVPDQTRCVLFKRGLFCFREFAQPPGTDLYQLRHRPSGANAPEIWEELGCKVLPA